MSMIDTLVEGAGKGRKIVVAGEMLELGSDQIEIHRGTGRKIASSGIDMLIGVRGLAKEMIEGALEAGFDNAEFAVDSDAAGDLILQTIKRGDVVLVKGSRGVRTEKVIEKLFEKFGLEKSR